MNLEDIEFPVYRRYKNHASYFKIINPRLFEEVQAIGRKRIVRQTEARQFPEMNFIRDLVLHYAGMAEAISAEEYEAFRT